MPAGRPYTSFLNPDADNTRATPKKKKAMTVAQAEQVFKGVKASPDFKMLKKQMGY